jgi:hypothetical protein
MTYPSVFGVHFLCCCKSMTGLCYTNLYYKERRQVKTFLTQIELALPLTPDPPITCFWKWMGWKDYGTTGKTAIAVRQRICRALSIGHTAKATLCRAPTPRRTAPINARCRSLCRASLPRRTAKSSLCHASDHSARQRGPGTCVARDMAEGGGGR